MFNFINGRALIVIFTITNIIYSVMIFWSIPKIMEFTGGLPPFDLRPMGYTIKEAMQFLDALSPAGIRFYQDVQLSLDLFYPLGFLFTYGFGTHWVFEKLDRLKLVGKISFNTAVLCAIADYTENYFVGNILFEYPQVNKLIIEQASNATVIKSICATITMCCFFTGFSMFFYRKLKMRNN